MPNILEKIFKTGTKEVVESIGTVVDNLSTTDAEKMEAKRLMTEIVLSKLNEVYKYQSDVIIAETNSESWLTKSWRPLTMITFVFIITMAFFFPNLVVGESGITGLNAIPERMWNLVEFGIGGYVVGRSAERVVDNVTKNIDLSFIRKKERNGILDR